MSPEAFSDGLLGWIIRLAGLFWLLGAFALLRQIRMEMTLDRLSAQIEGIARDAPEGEDGAQPQRTSEEEAEARWTGRDDAARRGWIAGQAVVLIATALAMMLLHSFAAWMAAGTSFIKRSPAAWQTSWKPAMAGSSARFPA